MSETAPKARGMTRAEAATVLTTLCREALTRSGFPLAAFEITPLDVERALIERRGLGGCSEDMTDQRQGEDNVGSVSEDKSVTTDASGVSVDTEVTEEVALEVSEGVYRVWQGWLEMTGQDKDIPVDAKSKGKIGERLAFGFTPEDLLQACRLVLADPSLVKRTKVRAISKPLESDQRVCLLLGRPYARPKRTTWLTPFEELWTKHYPQGEVPNFGVMGRWLAPLVEKHGEAHVLEQAEHYLMATNVAYVSWPKFASGYGMWDYGRTGRGGRESYARDALSGL